MGKKRTQRRRGVNWIWLAAGGVVAVLLVVLLIWANTSAAPQPPSGVLAQCGQKTCGQANAPVTIDEYSDFQ